MPRNVNGTYSLPLPPVVPNTTIEADWANTTDDDIAQALTDSLSRTGQGGMTAPFKALSGTVTTPGLAWIDEPTTGFYREASGVMSVTVAAAKVGQWSAAGLSLATGKTLTTALLTVNDAATFDHDVQPITLTGIDANIVWAQGGPNLALIGHDDASGQLGITSAGAGGIYLQDNTPVGLRFAAAKFGPIVAGAVALGSSALPWGSGYFTGQVAVVDTAVTMQSWEVGYMSLPLWTMTSSSDVTRAQGLGHLCINSGTNDFNFNSGYSYKAGDRFYLWNGDTAGRRIYKSADIAMYIDGSTTLVASVAVQPYGMAVVTFITPTACIVAGNTVTP